MAVAISTYWNSARGDNFATATDIGRSSAEVAGYKFIRQDGLVNEKQVAGSVPLTLYWSAPRQDNFTATPTGAPGAEAAGYERARIEGYVMPSMPTTPHTRLRSWWNSKRGDNFLTGSVFGDREAEKAGYERVRVAEGYGPAVRNIRVTRLSDETRIENYQTGVAQLYDGEGFTPGGMVYSEALSFQAGLPQPEYSLGSVQADSQGRIHHLTLNTTRDQLPGVPWVGIIIDAASGSEYSVGAVH